MLSLVSNSLEETKILHSRESYVIDRYIELSHDNICDQ